LENLNRRDLGIDRRIILEWMLENGVGKSGLDATGSE
jgi:hypothetical protein